jgi:hypothetical protein
VTNRTAIVTALSATTETEGGHAAHVEGMRTGTARAAVEVRSAPSPAPARF